MRISDWSSDVCSSDLDYADDLVQSCLVRAIGALETWEPGTNMRAWLFTILRNVLINEYRRAQRSPVQIKDMLEGGAAMTVAGNQEDDVKLTELQQALHRHPNEYKEDNMQGTVAGLRYEHAAASPGE